MKGSESSGKEPNKLGHPVALALPKHEYGFRTEGTGTPPPKQALPLLLCAKITSQQKMHLKSLKLVHQNIYKALLVSLKKTVLTRVRK